MLTTAAAIVVYVTTAWTPFGLADSLVVDDMAQCQEAVAAARAEFDGQMVLFSDCVEVPVFNLGDSPVTSDEAP
jgi:hypothetical protein